MTFCLDSTQHTPGLDGVSLEAANTPKSNIIMAHSRESETFVDFRKKSASLLDHKSRFLSHQFVTWSLRSISKTKIVKLFCPCMSEHMILYQICHKRDPNVTPNVTNVTKQNIASKEILTIEFHTKYMKLFVNMLSVICVLLNTKFITHQRILLWSHLSRTIVSCKSHKRDQSLHGLYSWPWRRI